MEMSEESKQPNQQPEDKYDIDEVCKMAVFVSEGSQGMFHYLNQPIPEPISKRKAMLFNQSNMINNSS